MFEANEKIKIAGRELTIHPAAAKFPMLEGDDYDLFKTDIKANGQRSKITLFGNLVLDGRNRLRAAKELKLEPTFEQYKGTDPVGEIISRNILRRHLTDEQRVALVASLRADEIAADAEKNKADALKGGKAAKGTAKGSTAQRIAKEAKVTEGKARSAIAAHKHAPDALKDVIAGKTKLSAAAAKASEAKAAKDKASGKAPKAKKEKSLKERVEAKFSRFMETFSVQEYKEVRAIIRDIVATADKKGQAAVAK